MGNVEFKKSITIGMPVIFAMIPSSGIVKVMSILDKQQRQRDRNVNHRSVPQQSRNDRLQDQTEPEPTHHIAFRVRIFSILA